MGCFELRSFRLAANEGLFAGASGSGVHTDCSRVCARVRVAASQRRSRTQQGTIRPRMFDDLPECVQALNERNERSRGTREKQR